MSHHHHHHSSSSSRSRSNSRGHRKHRNRRFIVIPGQQPAYQQGYYQQPTVYQAPQVHTSNQYGGQYGQQYGFTQPQGNMTYTGNMGMGNGMGMGMGMGVNGMGMGMNMNMGMSSDQQLKNAIDTIYYKYDRDGTGYLDEN